MSTSIHDTITALPGGGYDTFVEEEGSLFSGGRKLCLAISECSIRNPKLILLEEATSALPLDTNLKQTVRKTCKNCIYNSSA